MERETDPGTSEDEGRVCNDAATSRRTLKRVAGRDFPGGPVAKTPRSQSRGPGFDPYGGN